MTSLVTNYSVDVTKNEYYNSIHFKSLTSHFIYILIAPPPPPAKQLSNVGTSIYLTNPNTPINRKVILLRVSCVLNLVKHMVNWVFRHVFFLVQWEFSVTKQCSILLESGLGFILMMYFPRLICYSFNLFYILDVLTRVYSVSPR
jgi:hypothetical protein